MVQNRGRECRSITEQARICRNALLLLLLISSQGICSVLAAAGSNSNNATWDASKFDEREGGKLLEHFSKLASNVASVNGLMKNPDPLLLASHLPFLGSSCKAQADHTDADAAKAMMMSGKTSNEGEAEVEMMRTVGRALAEEQKPSFLEIPKVREVAGYWGDVLNSLDPIQRFRNDLKNPDSYSYDADSGKRFRSSVGVTFPSKVEDKPDKDFRVSYSTWMPDLRTFKAADTTSAWFLVIKLIDSVFLRWYVENAKCDFLLPTMKPYLQPAEVVCTRPKIKVSYCLKFQTRTPIISPSVPLCIPEDIMQTLFNVGPAIGGIVENIINQLSPYLLPLLNDYIANGGTQEQLFEALNILLGEPALQVLLRGNSGGGGVGGAASGGSALSALANLLNSPAIPVLLNGVDVGQLVLGDGFKGMLSTLISSPQVPPELQPLLNQMAPYIPYIISNYYGCGGETDPFFDAINSVLQNPVVKPFIDNPELLQSQMGNSDLIAATLPTLYASAITNNPPMYNWLVTLPNQCIVDQGYIQPVAVILTQGTQFDQVGAAVPKIVDDYYNTGCTTEQILAYAPVLLEAQTLPPARQTNVLFQKKGTTPSGEEVGFTTPFNGGPSILQCLTPNLAVLTTVLAVGK
jgi:hypothetical protein